MEPGVDLNNEEREVNPRLSDYKRKVTKSNQESRRHVLLQEQKRRREDSFNAFRDFSDIFMFDDESSHDEDLFQIEETVEKPRFPKLKDLFMFSEWMTELPLDFQDNWLFTVCPVGKRCLVRSCKGSTTVYGKLGYQMARFRSSLPNGGYRDKQAEKYSKSDMTVLDCIWNGEVQKYFILDVLYWKSQSCLDTDVGFRSFWIKSKIEEAPQISQKSNTNPYPFIPLNYYPCDIGVISGVMARYPHFDSDKPQVDGILFYHKDAFYTPGQTPLVLWVKPYMLVEILGNNIYVADEYFKTRPLQYTNMFDFISKYSELQKQKKKKKKYKKHRKFFGNVENMDVSAIEGIENFEIGVESA